MHYINCWDKATRILARLMKGLLTGDKLEPPTSAEFRAARNFQFLAAAPASTSALMQGHLQSLSAVKIGGEVWIQGRGDPDNMATALGCTGIRIIMPNTRLAFLIMYTCHQEDHRRDPHNAMARTRTIAWIPRSRQLAVKVVKGCYTCRREETRLAQEHSPMAERKLHLAGCSMTTVRAGEPAAAATSGALPIRRNLPCVKTIRFLLQGVEDIMHYTNCWDKATRILAHEGPAHR